MGGTQSHIHKRKHKDTHIGWMRRGGRGKEKPRLAMAGAGPFLACVVLLPCTIHDDN